MAGRKAKNIGGGTWYTAKDSNVAKEAEEKKHGGRARKSGGRAMGSHSGMMTGGRLDKRARGGRTGKGSDKSPFSSAAESEDMGRTSSVTRASGGRTGKKGGE